jgi:hypothetical protein
MVEGCAAETGDVLGEVKRRIKGNPKVARGKRRSEHGSLEVNRCRHNF